MPAPPNTEDLLTVVRAFLVRKGTTSAIDATTPLLASGLLDSFSLVELIGDLSSKLGMTLSPGELIPDDFESVETLSARLREIAE